ALVKYQPIEAIITSIVFNTVIATTQRTDTSQSLVCLDVAEAKHVFQIELIRKPMCFRANLPPCGNHFMNDFVQLLHFRLLAADLEHGHTATDIDPDEAGSDTVRTRHRRAYSAALAGMDIWHDSDFAILRNGATAECANQSLGTRVDSI